MRVRLVVSSGTASRGDVNVELPTIIGRSRTADLTIAHPMISRQHCQVYEVDGLVMVRDLGSLNGTTVEGQRINEAALRPHDEFTIGPLSFRAEYEYAGDLSAVPPPKLAAVTTEAPLADAVAAPEQPADQMPDAPLPDFSEWPSGAVEAAPVAAAEAPGEATVGVEPDDEDAMPAGGLVPDFSSWIEGAAEETVTPPEAFSAATAEPAAARPTDEDEEPEPTPPPRTPRPAAKKPTAKPAHEKEKPRAQQPQPRKPAKSKRAEPDEDDGLEDFLEGLQ